MHSKIYKSLARINEFFLIIDFYLLGKEVLLVFVTKIDCSFVLHGRARVQNWE